MRNFNNKSGFTLIEIIVVLIIVGVLAAVALPNLFGNIQKSKGAQAIALMDTYKGVFDSCSAQKGVTPGTAPCTMGGQNLPTASVNGWTYIIGAAANQGTTAGTTVAPGGAIANNNLVYSLEAIDVGPNSITLTRAGNGTWTCATGSASPYVGIC